MFSSSFLPSFFPSFFSFWDGLIVSQADPQNCSVAKDFLGPSSWVAHLPFLSISSRERLRYLGGSMALVMQVKLCISFILVLIPWDDLLTDSSLILASIRLSVFSRHPILLFSNLHYLAILGLQSKSVLGECNYKCIFCTQGYLFLPCSCAFKKKRICRL